MKEIDVPDFERVADVSDQASRVEAMANEESVKKVLKRIEKAPSHFDGVNCVDCSEPIPEARLKTGAFRDIHCQQKHELSKKNHRSHYE